MNSGCLWTQRLWWLGRKKDHAVQDHLERCAECRSLIEREERTADLITREMPRRRSPRSLREQVKQILEAKPPGPASPFLTKFPWQWLTAAAVLVAAVALFLYLAQLDRITAEQAVEGIIGEHMALALDPARAEFSSSSPEAVESWLREEMQLAPYVPRLRGARLLGARRSSRSEETVGLVFYQLDGEGAPPSSIISLHVLRGAVGDWPMLSTHRTTEDERFRTAHRRGVNLVIWRHLDHTYVLASRLDGQLLSSLVGDL